jgi:uncharacterized membrane protein YphA (DoxX/SURF4 family)
MLNFPRGRSGVGLLIARLTVSSLLLEIAINNLLLGYASVASYAIMILSLFVCFGLFTPIVCSIAALLTMALFLLVHNDPIVVNTATASLCVMLALVGAGAYSVDARLFGQRRVIWPPS